MESDRIRDTFIRFYEERGHLRMPSASLVPHGDPTLLFTSAGMVPFKPYFMGLASPPATRLTTVQKCFRTTDIEEVGDFSHLTFFEMLGNFSIGDYFKKEAIQWAWELLTEGFGLPKDKLVATIYLDDDEAYEHWRDVGLPHDRIFRYGEEANYWFSGDIGPCGPNSEINIDRGPRADCAYCQRGECKPNLRPECGRWLEVWNLVFMTLYQAEDGTRTPLPRKNIDTGSGLERVTCVLQGKETVYETDLFAPIIGRIEEISGRRYGEDAATDVAIRVVAEHARAATFLITDGVMPSNEGRGYVLRRILRRAVYFLTQLGAGKGAQGGTTLDRVADAVIEKMRGAHPDVGERGEFVRRLLAAEEAKFRETLERARTVLLDMLDARLAAASDSDSRIVTRISDGTPVGNSVYEVLEASRSRDFGSEFALSVLVDQLEAISSSDHAAIETAVHTWRSTLSGREAFAVTDTFGFPIELVEEVARRQGIAVDLEEQHRLLEAQRERGRAAAKFEYEAARVEAYTELAAVRTKFVGYDRLRHDTTIAAVIGPAGLGERASAGDEAEVVLIETPFYAEGGGQAGDSGEIVGLDGRFEVIDTQSPAEGLTVHRGRVVAGTLSVNDAVKAEVDATKRAASMRNHTATHLLHAALREVLGTHVRQAGSLVAPDRLRFDFTHIEATKPEELAEAQRLVNEKIRADIEVHPHEEAYDDAVASGAMALFGEKYTALVRVVDICDPAPAADEHRCFSRELCGGTHVHRTGEIGTFVIESEGSVGSGLRRIEARTGALADAYVLEQQGTIARLARQLNAPPPELEARFEAMRAELEAERRRAQQFERQAGRAEVDSLLAAAEQVDGASVLVSRVPAASVEAMREMGDLLRDRLGSAVVVLGAVLGEKPSFLAIVTKDLTPRVHAGNLIKQVAAVAGGGGGGRPEMATAGGKDPARLDEALGLARTLAREGLAPK